MAIKKFIKRAAKKVGRAAKRRYFKGKGYAQPKIGRMVKDISYLKSVLNPEKKRSQFNATDAVIAQCNGNTNAYYTLDITPVPAQGTTSVTRNGNSIRLSTSWMKFQFQNVASNAFPVKIRIMVVKVLGQRFTSGTTLVQTMFKPNSFITGASIYDFNSDRNEESFKQFRVLRQKVVTLQPNQISGVPSFVNAAMGLKYKSHHVKFTADGSTTVQDGQIWLLMFSDVGNASGSTASTLAGTPVTAVSTGTLVQHDITHYYYDN